MNKNIEILAPVGSFDSLKAAVQNGAGAVYLGGKEFSARASANNFDRDELREAVEYAHIRECKVFVTVNTIIKEEERENFLEYIRYLYMNNVDAIILQDIGMASVIKRMIPDFELHASTQMAAHSLNDVLYLESVGFKRVVLARELNIDEIKYISENSNADIEVFVHGALCVSYSGQCLMSSTLGTRSGNRGRCAQPCRQKYEIKNRVTGEKINTDGQYLLSPRDLNTVENIGKIVDTGILSLKIEGRMKRPEYVAAVVKAYYDAVKNYSSTHYENVTDETVDELYTIFNRKFTGGYLLGEVGKDVMNAGKPNNRGLYIGKVISYNKKAKRLKIKLERSLKKGDGLNIGGGTVGRIIKGKEICAVGRAGETIEIDYIGDIKSGTEIFKTSDTDLLGRVQKTYSENKELKKIPVKLYFKAKRGMCAQLAIEDYNGNRALIDGNIEAEASLKVALTSEKVEKQLSKLGDTPYTADVIICDIEDGISLPISEINNMRREVVEKLNAMRVSVKGRSYCINRYEEECKLEKSVKNREINVSCYDINSLKKALEFDIDNIYYRDINTLEKAIEICSEKNTDIYFYMPRIIRTFERKIYDRILKIKDITLEKLAGFRVSNYGEILFVKENFEQKRIRVSSWLNVINADSYGFYRMIGADAICFSQEMSLHQLNTIELDLSLGEYLIYGNTEMMLSEYCPMGVLTKDCKKNKRDAACNRSDYCLVSQSGEEYRLSQDENCRTTIYSDEIVNLCAETENLLKAGVHRFEISLRFESDDEISNVLETACENIKNNGDIRPIGRYSTGHLYKEID